VLIRPFSTAKVPDVLAPPGMSIVPVVSRGPCAAPVLRGAVAARRAPDATDFAAYLGCRSSANLAALFRSVLESDRDADALRLALRRHGRWLPHDWRALYRCVTVIGWAIAEGGTEEAGAERAAVHVKTVSGWCHRYFGWSWHRRFSRRFEQVHKPN
jgi:hypothetical protein